MQTTAQTLVEALLCHLRKALQAVASCCCGDTLAGDQFAYVAGRVENALGGCVHLCLRCNTDNCSGCAALQYVNLHVWMSVCSAACTWHLLAPRKVLQSSWSCSDRQFWYIVVVSVGVCGEQEDSCSVQGTVSFGLCVYECWNQLVARACVLHAALAPDAFGFARQLRLKAVGWFCMGFARCTVGMCVMKAVNCTGMFAVLRRFAASRIAA